MFQVRFPVSANFLLEVQCAIRFWPNELLRLQTSRCCMLFLVLFKHIYYQWLSRLLKNDKILLNRVSARKSMMSSSLYLFLKGHLKANNVLLKSFLIKPFVLITGAKAFFFNLLSSFFAGVQKNYLTLSLYASSYTMKKRKNLEIYLRLTAMPKGIFNFFFTIKTV